jgi:hypothetical protein
MAIAWLASPSALREVDRHAAPSDAPADLVLPSDPGATEASGQSGSPEVVAPATPSRRRWRRLRVAIVVSLSAALAVSGAVGFAAWRAENVLDAKITRFGDPFAAIPVQERVSELTDPDAPSGMPVVGSVSDLAVTPSPGAVNLLVFGSDSRISAGDPTPPPACRSSGRSPTWP